MNDKAIVEAAVGTFDVVVLQANLAASASKGLASWHKLDRPFWIDPVAYAFAANPIFLKSEQKVKGSTEKVLAFKRTFRTLAEAYGEPYADVLRTDRSLRPSDFNAGNLRASCARVLDWQGTVLRNDAADVKYGVPAALEPALYTVPYFPLQYGTPHSWLEVNIRLIEEAEQLRDPAHLACGLLVERDLFEDQEFFDEVLPRYAQLKAEHIWLWISDNDETKITGHRALLIRQTLDELVAAGKTVHIAFGGSFSTMMLAHGAASVGHGVGYWEFKNWEPLAGGGLPTLKFFYPPLYKRLSFLEADSVLDVEDAPEYHAEVCACDTCLATLDGDLARFGLYGQVEVRARTDRWNNRIEYDVPLPDSLRRTKLHYLQAKGIEVETFAAPGVDAEAVVLDNIARYENQAIVSLDHLRRWSRALR